MLNYITLVLLKPPKSMPVSKYGQQRENGKKKSPKTKKMVKKMKLNIFEKICNFSALDERDCQAASLFAHWGQFGRETRAWPHGADPPHFHMHIGEIGQFFRIRVFPATQVGLCVDGPCKTAGHLQNTPGTPAMDFPLGASGSQSALYPLHATEKKSSGDVKDVIALTFNPEF